MRRRGVLALGGAGLAAGCGFRPLYMPQRGSGGAVEELAAVYVPVIGERAGQLLRQALQRRMDGSGEGVAKKYELLAVPVINLEGNGIQADSSTSRYRLDASCPFTLRLLNLEHTVLTTGNCRVLDGYNIINQQYFASDLEGEAATKRVCEALADQVVQQLAVFLKRRATVV